MAEEIEDKKSEKDLKQIAMDLYENKIFSDRHLMQANQTHMIGSVFMPIMLGAFKDLTEEELKERVGMVYEYYDQAGPRGINGFPCFFSLRVLSPKETEKMFMYFEEYKKVKEAFANME